MHIKTRQDFNQVPCLHIGMQYELSHGECMSLARRSLPVNPLLVCAIRFVDTEQKCGYTERIMHVPPGMWVWLRQAFPEHITEPPVVYAVDGSKYTAETLEAAHIS